MSLWSGIVFALKRQEGSIISMETQGGILGVWRWGSLGKREFVVSRAMLSSLPSGAVTPDYRPQRLSIIM